MNELEKKVDALIRLCLADDGDDARAARKELECCAKQHRSSGGVSLRLQICRVLRELGVPEHLIGYEFRVDAVMLTVDKPDYLRRVTGRFILPWRKSITAPTSKWNGRCDMPLKPHGTDAHWRILPATLAIPSAPAGASR